MDAATARDERFLGRRPRAGAPARPRAGLQDRRALRLRRPSRLRGGDVRRVRPPHRAGRVRVARLARPHLRADGSRRAARVSCRPGSSAPSVVASRCSPRRRRSSRSASRCARSSASSPTRCSGFAAIGVVVGAFVIFNTFTILVTQRTRELGLLRAMGATGARSCGRSCSKRSSWVRSRRCSGSSSASGSGSGCSSCCARIGLKLPETSTVLLGADDRRVARGRRGRHGRRGRAAGAARGTRAARRGDQRRPPPDPRRLPPAGHRRRRSSPR